MLTDFTEILWIIVGLPVTVLPEFFYILKIKWSNFIDYINEFITLSVILIYLKYLDLTR